MKFLLASFLLGLLSACGFEPWGLWPLTLLAFAGLLWLIAQAPSLRSALARGYWFGVGQFTLGLNWIATAFTFQAKMPHWLGWIAVVLLSLYLAVYPAMATGLAWRWGSGRGADPLPRHSRESGNPASSTLAVAEGKMGSRFRGNDRLLLVLVLAAAWIVTEWLRATMFTGFAWNPVGVTLLPTGASRTATLIGTYGLSGITVLVGGMIFLIGRRQLRPALTLLGGVALLSLAAFFLQRGALPAPDVAVRIVQPNIGQQDKWREGFEEENFARLARLTGPPVPRPRLILWPEAAVTDPLGDNRPAAAPEVEALRRRVGALLGPGDLLLTGGITLASPDGLRVTQATNSVFAMDAAGRVLGRFDKAHLVPYGEYLPMRPILSAIGLSRLAPGDLDYIPGPGAQTLALPLAGKVGFQLCYEIIFSGEVVDPDNRPAFIYNPSNDAWFGAWGPPQHLAQARLRALEEGLPVLRSTPTGISAIVDAEGRLLHSLPWRTAGVIDATLPAPKPPTLFSRAGNAAPFLFALLLAAIAVAARRKSS
jgi:apolipoprotein N-acyltransferase